MTRTSGAWVDPFPHRRIMVFADVLSRERELQMWTAAHEVAHLAEPPPWLSRWELPDLLVDVPPRAR